MYGTPQGTDPNGQPIPYADLIGNNHAFGSIVQIEDPSGKVLSGGVSLLDGKVNVDRAAAFRRQCQLQLKPYGGSGTALLESLIPDSPRGLTAPYGNLVRLWYWIPLVAGGDITLYGTTYKWPLGVFRIADADISDDAIPTLSITGYDLSRTISRNKLTQPWIVAAGQNYGDAIIALARDRYPQLKARDHNVQALTPDIIVDPEQDPWQVITDWAAAFGHEVFFDTDGWLVVQPEPDPTLHPVDWVYGDGSQYANALLLGVDRTMSDEPGYNGVVMTTESTTLPAPLRSEVWDLNPSSPTYALGAYGRVPKFISNPYAATQEQLDAAATAELQRILGGTEKLSLAVMPNPAHEAGDIVRVIRPLSKTDQTAVLESFEFPLGPDAMRVSCRDRRSIA